MAITIEEFLVSVKYGIDEPSMAKFFDSLKRASTSIAGIAGQIVGLGIAVLKLADEMSEAGAKLYWMGQRLNETVTNIEAMSFALKEVGLSGEHATTALKQITTWTSSHGPAATMYLRSLGITATTAMGQIEQLGKRLMESGPRGSIQYAIELARMRSTFGLDEDTLRGVATPEYQAAKHHEGIIKGLVWGSDGEKGPDKFAAQSVKIQSEFGKMGAVFHNLTQRFGLGLFTRIQPELERLNRQLIENLPKIKAFLDQILDAAPPLLHFLEGAVKGFGWLLDVGTQMIKTFRELPDVLKFAIAAFLLLPKAMELAKSPLFLMLAGLSALMLLMIDYEYWKKDQETGSKTKHSYFDWSQTHDMFKGLEDNKALKAIMDFYGWVKKSFEEATGLKGVFDAIAVVLGAIILRYGIPMMLRLAGRGLGAGAGAVAAGAGAGVGAIVTAVMPYVIAALTSAVFIAAIGTIATALLVKLGSSAETPANRAKIEKNRQEMGPTAPSRMPTRDAPPVPPVFWRGKWVDPNTLEEVPAPSTETTPPAPTAPASSTRHGSLMRGGVQVAGARQGDGWAAVLIKEGMDDAHEDGGRLYDLLKLNLEAVVKHLSDILEYVMAMAKHSGAVSAGVGASGGGGGGGGDGNMTVPDIAGMTDEERNTLGLIRKYESEGGKNIMNFVGRGQGLDPATRTGSTAQGYYQMLNTNWRNIAPLYGIHTPNAMASTDAEQTQVALHLLRHGGIGNWINWNPKLRAAYMRGERINANIPTPGNSLRHRPLGAGGGAGAGVGADAGGAARSFAVNNSTSISVTAPNPGSAAMQVADHMPRVFEHHIRFAKGALLA